MQNRRWTWPRAAQPAVLALGLCLFTAPAAAQEQTPPGGFTPDQAQGIERIVREYLLDHPEVLVEALTEYQRRRELAEVRRQEQAVAERRQDLAHDPDAPVLGNPQGDVLVVEFFDYRCAYCKSVAPTIRDAVAGDGNVRLVMKEFPILGPQSVQAARAALASVAQGKYEAFHFALMAQPGNLSDAHIDRVAASVALDVPRLRRDMQAPEIDAALQRNFALAEALGIRGTPAFVIGGSLVSGAMDEAAFRHRIAEARARGS